MPHISFAKKLWMPLCISIVGFLAIGCFNIYHEREVRLQEKRIEITHAVQMALGVVKQYAGYAERGTMSEADAKAQALARLRVMKFGDNGFFVVDDFDAHCILHGDAPSLEGKDLRGFKDKAGNPVHVMISDTAKNRGTGFVQYVSPHTLGGTPVPKIAYVAAYTPWQWAVFTGVYTDDINAAVLQSTFYPVVVLATVIIILATFIAFLARSIQIQIGGDPSYASKIVSRISVGDLSENIQANAANPNSLLSSMRSMQIGLSKTVENITFSTDHVAVASQEISSGNLELSRRTSQQAAELSDTTANLSKIAEAMRRTTDNAKLAIKLSEDTARTANQSSATFEEVVSTMTDLSNQSHKMVNIIAAIEGIAFQTNILALNAAVESARAGEQGKGFAVVAGEVRNLAHRSAAAAKEIKDLINSSVSRVEVGSKSVQRAGVTMKDAQIALAKVSAIVVEIEAAAHQQSLGIDQIATSIDHLDVVTQQNAALVEEASAAATSLDEQAQQLRVEMATFKIHAATESRRGSTPSLQIGAGYSWATA